MALEMLKTFCLTNKRGNGPQGTRMVRNKVICQVVGNQTRGSVTFCLPASLMEGCHHYMRQGNGSLGRLSTEVWVLYNCPGKEKRRAPLRDLSLGRVFSTRCNKAPLHIPLCWLLLGDRGPWRSLLPAEAVAPGRLP